MPSHFWCHSQKLIGTDAVKFGNYVSFAQTHFDAKTGTCKVLVDAGMSQSEAEAHAAAQVESIFGKLVKQVTSVHAAVARASADSSNTAARVYNFATALLSVKLPHDTARAFREVKCITDPFVADIEQLTEAIDNVMSDTAGPILIHFRTGPGRMLLDLATDALEQRGREVEIKEQADELHGLEDAMHDERATLGDRLAAMQQFRLSLKVGNVLFSTFKELP